MPKKLPSIPSLEKKLDDVFSKFIRLRDAGTDGYNKCCTCSKVLHWKEANCCHFVPRAKRATRWDETNCYSGCTHCNFYNELHHYHLGRLIDKLHGEGTADQLIRLGHSTFKVDRGFLMQKIDYYKDAVTDMLKIVKI